MIDSIKYEDVYLIFSRKNLKEKAFSNLDNGNFWQDVKSASWMSHRSSEVKNSFDEVKNAIIRYSDQLGISGTGFEQLYNEVQKLYPQLKKDVEVFKIEHERQTRKNNRTWLLLVTILPPTFYILDLAVESSSLDPSDWYWVFKSHLRFLGKFIVAILWCALLLAGLFSFAGAYKFLDTKFPKKRDMYEQDQTRILPALVALIVVVFGMIIVRNGVLGTFGIDLLPR